MFFDGIPWEEGNPYDAFPYNKRALAPLDTNKLSYIRIKRNLPKSEYQMYLSTAQTAAIGATLIGPVSH